MDFYAYMHIEYLQYILDEQKIDVPRLRGLRLMKYQEKVSQETLEKTIKNQWFYICENIIEQGTLSSWSSEKYDTRNDVLIRSNDNVRAVIGVRWSKVHGKKRKQIKFEFKKAKKTVIEQYNMFNRYVGQNVLYVHARIGGRNWNTFKGWELLEHPDFLERCDDCNDETYCDIYFKLNKDYPNIVFDNKEESVEE